MLFDMNVAIDRIIAQPEVITVWPFRLESRHKFLQALKRDQYDPTQPRYVPFSAFLLEKEEFCSKYSKTSVDVLDAFVKSL